MLALLCVNAGAFQGSSKTDLTLVSFNVRYGTPGDGENKWKSRRARVFAIFEKYKDGIIGVQEALPNQIAEILEAVPELGVVYRTRNTNEKEGEATPIFYNKKTWRLVESETYWLSDTPDVPGSTGWGNTLPRITTEAVFEKRSGGRKVRILNTHLDHRSEPARAKSVELMLERIANYSDDIPTLMLGDFNAKPGEEVVNKLTESLKDSYTGGQFEGCTYHNWLGGRNCPRIDYIFYPATEVRFIESGIDRFKKGNFYPSDHYPVYASFALN